MFTAPATWRCRRQQILRLQTARTLRAISSLSHCSDNSSATTRGSQWNTRTSIGTDNLIRLSHATDCRAMKTIVSVAISTLRASEAAAQCIVIAPVCLSLALSLCVFFVGPHCYTRLWALFSLRHFVLPSAWFRPNSCLAVHRTTVIIERYSIERISLLRAKQVANSDIMIR